MYITTKQRVPKAADEIADQRENRHEIAARMTRAAGELIVFVGICAVMWWAVGLSML